MIWYLHNASPIQFSSVRRTRKFLLHFYEFVLGNTNTNQIFCLSFQVSFGTLCIQHSVRSKSKIFFLLTYWFLSWMRVVHIIYGTGAYTEWKCLELFFVCAPNHLALSFSCTRPLNTFNKAYQSSYKFNPLIRDSNVSPETARNCALLPLFAIQTALAFARPHHTLHTYI